MLNDQEFVERATQQVSANPHDRLSPLARAAVQAGNPVFDIHCHIFDRKCVHALYFALRTIGIGRGGLLLKLMNRKSHGFKMNNEEDVYAALVAMNRGRFAHFDEDAEWSDIKTDMDDMEMEEENLIPVEHSTEASEGSKLNGLWAALRIIFKGSMKAVLQHYLKHHAFGRNSLDELKSRNMITGVIMMDIEKGWRVGVKKSQTDQIAEIKELMAERPIIPFLSLDPRRYGDVQQNIYDLFLEAFSADDASFFGVKFYPALGYHPADVRLKAIYEVCEAKGIPVVTHCGGAVVSTYDLNVSGMKFTKNGNAPYSFVASHRQHMATQLNEPALWQDVLECFPKLRLNLGHHGGGSQWTSVATAQQSPRVQLIEQMMGRFDNLYADFSFNFDDDMADTYAGIVSQNALLRSRAMFGTDYWVVLPIGNLIKKQAYLLDKMKGVGMLEEFVSSNTMRYLGI
jgi:predicted TIM-barrel fold metal-dependent hydrolase